MKVYVNLKCSPLTFSAKGLLYFFSTELHRAKFIRTLEENRKTVRDRLLKRYRFDIDSDYLADVYLYRSIENRGFYILSKEGVEYTCPEMEKLNGLKPTINY